MGKKTASDSRLTDAQRRVLLAMSTRPGSDWLVGTRSLPKAACVVLERRGLVCWATRAPHHSERVRLTGVGRTLAAEVRRTAEQAVAGNDSVAAGTTTRAVRKALGYTYP